METTSELRSAHILFFWNTDQVMPFGEFPVSLETKQAD
jgi:hypothetical protein